MSKTRLYQWNQLMLEIKALYEIEYTMTVDEYIKRITPLRERQDELRDK